MWGRVPMHREFRGRLPVSAAFIVVFGLFLVLMVGLVFASVRWGVRRDRAARREAVAAAAAANSAARTTAPATTRSTGRPVGGGKPEPDRGDVSGRP